MSSNKPKPQIGKEFTKRFVEICGTSKPAEIQRSFNFSYQSAKNYLSGRIPSAEQLIRIADVTGCSIHWLLTGHGDKYVHTRSDLDTLLASGQFKRSVREIVAEVLNERSGRPEPNQPMVVNLPPSEIYSEKTTEKAALSEAPGDKAGENTAD